MEFIRNEVELKKQAREERDKLKQQQSGSKNVSTSSEKKEEKKTVVLPKSLSDIQKRKLDKLMSDPSKEVYIPEPRKEWKPRTPMEFVRDVMGSSAGAGSGEFHVYQNAKKREQKRLDYLDRKALRDDLDSEFVDQVEENKRKAEETTAKKREKRLRKKKKKELAKKRKTDSTVTEKAEEEVESSEDEAEDEGGGGDKEAEEPHFVIGGE